MEPLVFRTLPLLPESSPATGDARRVRRLCEGMAEESGENSLGSVLCRSSGNVGFGMLKALRERAPLTVSTVRMSNPWLDIPLEDYEGHMSLPAIGQAQMLADQLVLLIERERPTSIAVVGCAGGTGSVAISPWRSSLAETQRTERTRPHGATH